MANISAVLFDYGLVLSGPPDPAAWARLKTLLSADEERFHQAYWAHRDAYDRGILNAVPYWNTVAADLGIASPDIPALIDADTDLWTQPNQPMIDWAAALRRSGIKTGVLSNIGDAMETGVLSRHPWLRNFDHHTFSHRLGIAKPDPAIYAVAATGLDTAPEAILFIDDRAENIAAARSAGMRAVQYETHSAFLSEMENRGLNWLLTSTLP